MDGPKPGKMAMLRKLRRGSKDSIPVPTERRDSFFATPPSTPTAATPGKLTFFDLPAEIRNHVYDLTLSNTVLYLPSPSPEDRKKKSIPVCGLLLASRQCRKEYLPLFYATAPVVIDIKDFDFRNVMKVIGGLYSTELKAFRANNALVLRLRTLNCTKANLDGLRRWLTHRADSLDRLPFRYEVFVAGSGGRISCFRQSREIAYYGERLARMQVKLEDTLQWELQAIVAAFDRKGAELAEALQGVPHQLDPSRRPIYGLSGGGLR
ncbi:ferrochelatase hem15 [Friedmanniomyces endolithicus]|uniref:Ferrochelatase hem15 n=1 Tax=Friedmanniomyces endolithicus TaxID=329885 RepID=A0AAN6HAC2_9PEZI|nr:ferrochelatase hem15 [Friedmanniomyces endolithicus]KAK0960774.1 ferrochelatase hem15 [Friedmanniomyces endolithicus]KAK0962162.1 ferrochelatase hem15 [Friedmanniomyces endolithicus]KAK1077510.1 ferrochelatase hem15 [Friedmanniomyces endolithicus]